MNKVVASLGSFSENAFAVSKDLNYLAQSDTSTENSDSGMLLKARRGANDNYDKENFTYPENLRNALGKSPMQLKVSSNVGFSKMPDQIYRKAIQRGFTFNILLVGATGLGKATFLNTLFMTDIYNDQNLGPSSRYYKDTSTATSVTSHHFNLVEQNVRLHLTVIDAPGFGEAIDNSTCWHRLVEEIDRRNAASMAAELQVDRGTDGPWSATQEGLVHVCFYFISPSGHGVRNMDLEAMRALCDKVNLIPIIAKADTMTVDECRLFKSAVQSQLSREGIHTYEFPLSAISEASSIAEVSRLRLRQPFAVCTSSHVITKEDGSKVRCRVYPWGTVETDSLEHNDFQALKILVMRYFLQDLIDVTYTTHYSNYRANRLTGIMQAIDFNLQDGREPLSQLDAERKAHQVKLEKLVVEMNEVYSEKVQEREQRLKDTELEVAKRLQQMQKELKTEGENLATARQVFYDERIAWETENQDNTNLMYGSMEKFEKLKKHRRVLF